MAVFTVTSAADDGPESLRQAIVSANATADADEIHFAIPGPGVHTIAPASPLPEVTQPLTIDGRTQPGYAGAPLIELSGAIAGGATDGLVFTQKSGPGVVAGLAVNRFGRHGVVFAGSSQQSIVASYVGTTADGTAAAGNGDAGVLVSGGGSVGGGNVISGNGGPGVIMNPGNVSGAAVRGSYIGTDATGSYAVGNGREGVLLLSGLFTLVDGNVISGNAASGVRRSGAGGINLSRNFIGTDAAGQHAVPNGTSPLLAYHDGLTVEGPGPIYIGSVPLGDVPGGRNVISGNVGAGIMIRGGSSAPSSPSSPAIIGNFVGTDSTGNVPLGNGGGGIRLIGPTGQARVMGNVISGNGGDGVYVAPPAGAPSGAVSINGNYIGTNVTGTSPVGNGGDGVALAAGATAAVGGVYPSPIRQPDAVSPILVNSQYGGNIISANGGAGVSFRPAGAGGQAGADPGFISVIGNVIGSDVLGAADLGNGGDGVSVVSTAGPRVAGNLVSGNGGNGVFIEGSMASGTVTGNYIGTNGTGSAAIPNDASGVVLRATRSVGVGGVGNLPTGTLIYGGSYGPNVISGNRGHGVLIDAGPQTFAARYAARVANNRIGTDAGGTLPLGNGGSGVYVAAGSNFIGGGSGAPNIISANGGDGITIAGTYAGAPGIDAPATDRNEIYGNLIGTGAFTSPTAAPINLGNRGNGIAVYNSPGNRIGHEFIAAATIGANVVAFNGGSGVLVEADPPAGAAAGAGPGDGNVISSNTIFSNARLGIDLSPGSGGVTPNDDRDGDLGPNRLQNYPVITGATSGGRSTVVRFTLNSEPGGLYRIEFFSSPVADASGFGEGRRFLGATYVRTDANGTASGTATLFADTPALSFVTATATSPAPSGPGVTVTTGSTSEFSRAVMVRVDVNGDGVINALDLGVARRALSRAPAPPSPVSRSLLETGDATTPTVSTPRTANDLLG